MCSFLDRLELLANGATEAAKRSDVALNQERGAGKGLPKPPLYSRGGTSSKVELKSLIK